MEVVVVVVDKVSVQSPWICIGRYLLVVALEYTNTHKDRNGKIELLQEFVTKMGVSKHPLIDCDDQEGAV